MESKYDRVDVPENLYLHSENEHNEDFGTGVYPISVISRKSNLKSDTVKVACFRMRRKSRCFLMIGGVIFLIIVILLIVVASNHNGSDKAPARVIEPSFAEEIKLKGIFYDQYQKLVVQIIMMSLKAIIFFSSFTPYIHVPGRC